MSGTSLERPSSSTGASGGTSIASIAVATASSSFAAEPGSAQMKTSRESFSLATLTAGTSERSPEAITTVPTSGFSVRVATRPESISTGTMSFTTSRRLLFISRDEAVHLHGLVPGGLELVGEALGELLPVGEGHGALEVAPRLRLLDEELGGELAVVHAPETEVDVLDVGEEGDLLRVTHARLVSPGSAKMPCAPRREIPTRLA